MWLLIIFICLLVILTIAYIYAIVSTRDNKEDKFSISITTVLVFLTWFSIGGAVCTECTPSIEDYNRGKVDTIIKYTIVNNDTISCDTIYKLK